MLKTTRSIKSAIKTKETGAGIGGNNRVGSSKVTNQINSIKGKIQAKITKSTNLLKSKNRDFLLNSKNIEARPGFFISGARLGFIKLRQVLIKTLVLYHFDLKYPI